MLRQLVLDYRVCVFYGICGNDAVSDFVLFTPLRKMLLNLVKIKKHLFCNKISFKYLDEDILYI